MPVPSASPGPETASGPRRRSLAETRPLLLVRAAHPRQAVLTALGMAVAATVSGRAPREAALVLVTVLVGQAVLGWDNDRVDESSDRVADRADKPLVTGGLDRGSVGFALACAVLLLVPLALSSGITAGLCYLLSVLAGVAGNRWLRDGLLSWLPWAVSFALYPAYLAYGGWGGGAEGDPPTIAMTLLASLLGVGVHVVTSVRGLVDDNRTGRQHLPLRLALWVGAPRLRVLSVLFCLAVVGVACLVGTTVGLSQ